MNTLWLKIAAVAVGALIVVVIAGRFMGGDKPAAPAPSQAQRASTETKTVYDTFKEDDKRLNAVPSANQPQAGAQAQAPATGPAEAAAQAPVQPVRIPKFRSLEEEQQVRAEELWNMVLTSRKMGRLPGMTYGQMVQYCRQILKEFPGTKYAFQAKNALADIPESAQRSANVTKQELDTSEFYK